MNDWNEGYFTDSTYIYGYYRDICPVFQRFCLLIGGFAANDARESDVHCELGYGQGVSINIHAAATPGKYIGTDFNPAHAAHANELREASGADAIFLDASFAEMLERNDLPQFDSVSAHGIWSWVSHENRNHIVEFARRFLKPGGIFFNSYNCLPGWAPTGPLRELFVLYDKYAHKSANTDKRIEEALNFTEKFFAAAPTYEKYAPELKPLFETVKKANKDYVAHEYFNRDWLCVYFTDVVEALGAAKLDYACSAMPLDALDHLNVKPDALNFLNSIENRIMREQTRDYFVHQQFRKDIYMRGLRKISAAEQSQKILDTRYVLTTLDEIAPKFPTPAGEAALSENVLNPILEYLAEDNYAPKNFNAFPKKHPDITIANLEQALIILVHRGSIMPCQSEATAASVKKRCDALNEYIMQRAKWSGDISTLASPALGGGFALNRINQLFLLSYRQNKKEPAAMANEVWRQLAPQGLKLAKNRQRLMTAEENVAELANMAQKFLAKQLPILKALQIA